MMNLTKLAAIFNKRLLYQISEQFEDENATCWVHRFPALYAWDVPDTSPTCRIALNAMAQSFFHLVYFTVSTYTSIRGLVTPTAVWDV